MRVKHTRSNVMTLKQAEGRRLLPSVDPIYPFEQIRRTAAIDTALSSLNQVEQNIVRMAFGFDGPSITLDNISALTNRRVPGRTITKARVSQILAKALRKLRHPTRSVALAEFVDRRMDYKAPALHPEPSPFKIATLSKRVSDPLGYAILLQYPKPVETPARLGWTSEMLTAKATLLRYGVSPEDCVKAAAWLSSRDYPGDVDSDRFNIIMNDPHPGTWGLEWLAQQTHKIINHISGRVLPGQLAQSIPSSMVVWGMQ